MRLPLTALLVVGLVALVAVPLLLAADTPNLSRAWARFDHVVKFADVLLAEGDYLFVHDDDKKAMGEPCLYVFSESNTDEPLAAIHCRRQVREPDERTRVVWVRPFQGSDLRQLDYIQFAGDNFAHYVR